MDTTPVIVPKTTQSDTTAPAAKNSSSASGVALRTFAAFIGTAVVTAAFFACIMPPVTPVAITATLVSVLFISTITALTWYGFELAAQPAISSSDTNIRAEETNDCDILMEDLPLGIDLEEEIYS